MVVCEIVNVNNTGLPILTILKLCLMSQGNCLCPVLKGLQIYLHEPKGQMLGLKWDLTEIYYSRAVAQILGLRGELS